MNSYLIIHKNNKIKIYEYINNLFYILRNNGEDEQNFATHLFWIWWKEKINYKNELVSFVVLTDQDFFIPDDIKIADKLAFGEKEINKLIKYKILKLKILYFPDYSQSVQSLENIKEANILNKYFVNKTKEFKNNNNIGENLICAE